jgi:predicted nucleic acid-binding protein
VSVAVDASMLVAAPADAGREGVWAESVLAHGDLVAPQLVRVEATNVLRRLERARLREPREADEARRDVLLLPLDLFPFVPLAERISELRRTVSSYDARYVALAEAIDAPLATLDRRLRRTSDPRCRFLATA